MLSGMDIAEIDLARGDIPPSGEPWILVDIRRMAGRTTTGGPREADGGLTWYVDDGQPEDLKVAIHEARLAARQRGLQMIYVRGRNA